MPLLEIIINLKTMKNIMLRSYNNIFFKHLKLIQGFYRTKKYDFETCSEYLWKCPFLF